MPRVPLMLLAILLLLVAACGNSPDRAVAEQNVAPLNLAPQHDGEPRVGSVAEVDSMTLATHAAIIRRAEDEGWAARPIGEVIHLVGEQLLGSAYVEHMLDQDDDEALVVSLAGFDCVLFNEAAIAMAQAIRAGEHDFEAFSRNIESLRYRDGHLVDYCSRLHYYSDWLRDNHRRGNLRIITDELTAAEPFEKRIDFMTEHRDAYRQLADDEVFACIRNAQADLNRESFMYVPQERIEEVYDQLRTGDVLALTTNVGGLDIAHTGFVYRHADGRVGMIHASTTGRVKTEPDLATYVRGIRIQNGIMVARAEDKVE